MTALLFITIAGLFLVLLTFWILNTNQSEDRVQKYREHFAFESSTELAANEEAEFYLGVDGIKLRVMDNGQLRVSWNLSRSRWERACQEYDLQPDLKYLVLRISSAHGEQLDMWIRSLAGQYKFWPESYPDYCACLGIKPQQQFHPIIVSDIIIPPLHQ